MQKALQSDLDLQS